jgi:hypothetical protein
MINDMGIPVYEKAPDAEALLLREPVVADEEAAEEAAAALATTVDAEFGRTTDPVRMYMREMGTVELLTREGEIAIAKRIEEGLDSVRRALSAYPPTFDLLLRTYEPVKNGQGRLVDVIVGFVDPNAPDVIAEPINPKLAAAKAEAEEEVEDEGEGVDGEGDTEGEDGGDGEFFGPAGEGGVDDDEVGDEGGEDSASHGYTGGSASTCAARAAFCASSNFASRSARLAASFRPSHSMPLVSAMKSM